MATVTMGRSSFATVGLPLPVCHCGLFICVGFAVSFRPRRRDCCEKILAQSYQIDLMVDLLLVATVTMTTSLFLEKSDGRTDEWDIPFIRTR